MLILYNSGIYKIINHKTNDFYIGQSTELKTREYTHFFELKNNKHHNSHLQNAYNKYGYENLEFKILLYCEPKELIRYEQYFVDKLNPSYNILVECVITRKGTRHSEESKKKISFSQKDMKGILNPMFGVHRFGSLNPMFGKKHSLESKIKISESKIGKPPPNKGKPHSDETKKKMSESGKIKIFTKKHRENLSKAKKGKPSNRWKNKKEK